MIKDIGNKCIYCFKDTKIGSGLFVNRIPAENDDYEGYLCPECQDIEEWVTDKEDTLAPWVKEKK